MKTYRKVACQAFFGKLSFERFCFLFWQVPKLTSFSKQSRGVGWAIEVLVSLFFDTVICPFCFLWCMVICLSFFPHTWLSWLFWVCKNKRKKGRLYPRLYQFYGPMTSFVLGVSASIRERFKVFFAREEEDTITTTHGSQRIGLPLMLLS